MALVIGNKRIQSIIPVYDDLGALVALHVRVNRDIVDDSTTPPRTKHVLPTTGSVDILPQLTATQQTTAKTFLNRVATLVSSLAEFEE